MKYIVQAFGPFHHHPPSLTHTQDHGAPSPLFVSLFVPLPPCSLLFLLSYSWGEPPPVVGFKIFKNQFQCEFLGGGFLHFPPAATETTHTHTHTTNASSFIFPCHCPRCLLGWGPDGSAMTWQTHLDATGASSECGGGGKCKDFSWLYEPRKL